MEPDIAISDLLTHADFVRRLALRLLGDEQRAAEATQETWLAALEHPPQQRRNLRAWLAKVARNASFRLIKRDARRHEWERKAALPESIPSTVDLVERAELRQRMVSAVLALDDPYRSAILYRYYEGLATRQIAAALEVPLETVRSRLKRGLAILRGRLTAEFGSRSAWCLALAPVAGLTLGGQQAVAGGAVLSSGLASLKTVISGGLVMTTKIKTAAIAAVVLGTAFLVWQLAPDVGDRAPGGFETHWELAPADLPPTDQLPGPLAGKDETRPVEDEGELVRKPLQPGGVIVAGRVVDMATGMPVSYFEFGLWSRMQEDAKDSDGLPNMIREVVADNAGRFKFRVEQAGSYGFEIKSPSHLHMRREIEVTAGGLRDMEIGLDPGVVISGRVVDDATGEPVSGAIVGSRIQTHLEYILILGSSWNTPHAVTGADGRFRLGGLNPWKGPNTIAAAHPDFAEGNIRIDSSEPPPEEVEIRLPRGFRIFGTVRDDAGAPAAGIVVSIYGSDIKMAYPVLTRADGFFQTSPAVPGKVTVTARSPISGVDRPVFTAETRSVEIMDADVRVDFGPSNEYVTWRGTLFDYDGTPAPGAEITLNPEPFYSHGAPIDRRQLARITSQEGRFIFGKMHPYLYTVRIEFPGRKSIIEWGEIELNGEGVLQRDIRIGGSAVSGVVIDGATGEPLANCSGYVHLVGYNEDGTRRRYSANVHEDPRFMIRGILPGEYVITANLSGHPRTEVPLPPIGLTEVVRDFELVLPAGGLLKLKVTNIGAIPARSFELALVQGDAMGRGSDCRFDARGIYEQETALAPGRWKAVMLFKGLGFAETPFVIAAGKTTEMKVDCADLEFFEGTVTVMGKVTQPDGSAAVKARVVFLGDDPTTERRLDLEVVTDDDGRFELPGFRPGSYAVRIYLSRTRCVGVDSLDIPPIPSDPFPCRITIPAGGTVRGRIVEEGSGLKIARERSRAGIVHINQVNSRRSAVDEIDRDGFFEVHDVPEGLCRIRIYHLKGYEPYESGPFRVTTGESVDLGAVEVQRAPAGSIDLEVSGIDGERVHHVNVEITNDRGFEYKVNAGLPNTFDRLPVGVVRLKLSKEGYKSHEEVLDLLPDKPARVRIILEVE